MTWFDGKSKNPEVGGDAPDGKGAEGGPPEKTPAELIAESLTPLRDSISQLTSKITELEAGVVRKPEKPSGDENQHPTMVSVLENEDVAIAQRMAPLYKMQLEMAASLARKEVIEEFVTKGYGDLISQFKQRIDTLLDGTALTDGAGNALRGDKGYIRNTINMVIGEAATAAGLKFGGKDKGFFVETANGEGLTIGQKETEGLTPSQVKVFQRYKVPLADAKKTIAKLKFVS